MSWHVASNPSPFDWVVENERGDEVAYGPTNTGLSSSEVEAAKTLVAAAPDLAQALEDALSWANHPPGCAEHTAGSNSPAVTECVCFIARGKAALKKAGVL